jgi:hypothetical protein
MSNIQTISKQIADLVSKQKKTFTSHDVISGLIQTIAVR